MSESASTEGKIASLITRLDEQGAAIERIGRDVAEIKAFNEWLRHRLEFSDNLQTRSRSYEDPATGAIIQERK